MSAEITYQSWLGAASDTTGITDVVDILFRLYDAETGGDLLWSESQAGGVVDRGIFNVILGSVTSIPANIFTGDPLWLETQVETDTLSPRKKLVSVGYAIKAEKADTADYALSANMNYVDSAGVSVNAWKLLRF